MSDKVYLMKASSGEYDDWSEIVLAVFENEEQALAKAERMTAAVQRAQENARKIESRHRDLMAQAGGYSYLATTLSRDAFIEKMQDLWRQAGSPRGRPPAPPPWNGISVEEARLVRRHG